MGKRSTSIGAYLVATLGFFVFFGVPVFSEVKAFLYGVNSAELTTKKIKKIKNLKSDIIRLDAFAWDIIEKKRGVFDYSASDAMVKIAKKNKMEILGLLQYSPSWASGTTAQLPKNFSPHCGIPEPDKEIYDKYRAYPPLDPHDFATFVYMTVRRYPQITHWQIWNEPNNPVFWRGAPNAEEYSALLKEAYGAAKRANPNAVIVMGGLSLNDLDFLGKIYAAGGRNYFDVMAVHPYNPAQAPKQYLQNELLKLKAFLDVHQDSTKEIWITEIGWATSTSTSGVSEEAQAEYVQQTFQIADELDFVGAVFWHTLADCTANLNKALDEQNYGLYRSDWSEKPGIQKYKELIDR